ncbi:hypothetical protein ACNFIA_14790 [Pseudomonas sp. NY15437]|uniref:hypothetical protein n=1 Tax=unclassified Pseudomonas TaxID=196821 RepID=UPI0006D3C1C1|nr:hypothetical protein [Pseudomonas sp. NBRC 111135]
MKRRARKSLVLVLLVALGASAVNAALNWGSCSYYGFQTGRDTRYAAFMGCMVKTPAGWVPRNELRVIQ